MKYFMHFLIKFQGARAAMIRPDQHVVQSGEFDGVTTHNADFRKKQAS